MSKIVFCHRGHGTSVPFVEYIFQKKPLTTHLGQEISLEDVGVIANKILVHLEGLNKPAVDSVLEWIKNSIEGNYTFLSQPTKALN